METQKKEMTKYNYSTTKERMEAIKIQAIKEGRNVNEILNEIVDEYLRLVQP